MKRKLTAVVMCIMLLAGLTACGSMTEDPYGNYELDQYLKVGKYKGLEVDGIDIEVTKDEVDARIQQNLEAAKTTKELDSKAAVKNGDTVNIDYVGTKDGKKFDGGSAEGYDLEIGSNSFIEGFESGLVGKKVGETVKLNLKFPENYQAEELKGADVVFTVTINSAKRQEIPKYGLDFVKNTTKYKTLKEYENAVEKTLYNEKEAEAVNSQKTELWSQALKNTKVLKYPDEEVNAYIKFNSDQMDAMAKQYGMSRADVLAQYDFGDEDAFAAVNEDSSKLRVKQEMLLDYIADKEKLTYTDEEAEALQSDFEAQGYSEADIEKQTGRTMQEYLHIELMYQKVLDYLLENAAVKAVK